MCGIVAATNPTRTIIPLLLTGLARLEYRGYDSAGIAWINSEAKIERQRTLGRVAKLTEACQAISAHCAIAHTRWATHGAPSEDNAHPHIGVGVAIVHNGIIENHQQLKQQLIARGAVFCSQTDSEVIAHLFAEAIKTHADPLLAFYHTTQQLKGAYALAAISERWPERVWLARQGSPLLIGVADEGCYGASDAAALLSVTRQVIYLNNGDVAELAATSYRIIDRLAQPVERPLSLSQLDDAAVELGQYDHFMQKEIFEQPDAIANTLGYLGQSEQTPVELFGADAADLLPSIDSVVIIACGTSYYAGLTARYWLEEIAGIPCSVDVASEFRYRRPALSERPLILAISQSGETADTLAALHFARELGATTTLALCNVPESSLVRESRLRFITHAGPEIGVASTKAFTTQLTGLFLLTLVIARLRGRLGGEAEARYLDQLRHLPVAMNAVLALEPSIKTVATALADKQHALFLGRGRHFPIALEGALKLKEITYIHAEGYAAGELKHGPLALVDAAMPVIAVGPNDDLWEKLSSNLQEVRARGGRLYVFADADSELDASWQNEVVVRLPEHYGILSPILHVLPMQLLAYHTAVLRGADIDKPRNLAKSVTVE